MKKKVVALLVMSVMAVSLLMGCGGSSDTKPSDTSNDGTLTEDDITITMMFSRTEAENDFETKVLPALVKEAFPKYNIGSDKAPGRPVLYSSKNKTCIWRMCRYHLSTAQICGSKFSYKPGKSRIFGAGGRFESYGSDW